MSCPPLGTLSLKDKSIEAGLNLDFQASSKEVETNFSAGTSWSVTYPNGDAFGSTSGSMTHLMPLLIGDSHFRAALKLPTPQILKNQYLTHMQAFGSADEDFIIRKEQPNGIKNLNFKTRTHNLSIPKLSNDLPNQSLSAPLQFDDNQYSTIDLDHSKAKTIYDMLEEEFELANEKTKDGFFY